MKLHERLCLRSHFWSLADKVEGVEIANTINPKANDYDRAWKKFDLPFCRHLLSLGYYYSDEHGLAKEHADQCIPELAEFFFGDWRNTSQTPEKSIDPGWWKRGFIWMQLFEAAVLWGSVLGRWDFLKRVGYFPDPDSCISDGYRAVDRDLYVAWAAFLRGASAEEIEPLLEQVQSGRSRPAKLVLAMIRAGLSKDAAAFQKALVKWLEHYRKEEFPKEKMTKKITVEGTFFVHWAKKEGLPVAVPPEFTDHIVRLG
jgi:hypothetical protein